MRRLLAALCALVVGCTPVARQGADRGAWSEPYPVTTTYVVEVGWEPKIPHGGRFAWGIQTSTLFGIPRTITLSGEMLPDDNLCRNVAAHEIGHALGLDHYTGPTYAWMLPSHERGLPVILGPTENELAKARGKMRGKRLMLDIHPTMPPRLRVAVVWACHAWNRAFQREVLVLR